MSDLIQKLSDALGVIALERKHASGGYLSRSDMAQVARRALKSCEMEWPTRHGDRIAGERQLFFEGSIRVRLTAKDLEVDIEGISHMVDRESIKLAVSEAVCRHLEDTTPENNNGR